MGWRQTSEGALQELKQSIEAHDDLVGKGNPGTQGGAREFQSGVAPCRVIVQISVFDRVGLQNIYHILYHG